MCDAVAMGVVFPFLKMERDKSPVKKKDMSNVCPLCVTYVKKPVNAVKLKYQCAIRYLERTSTRPVALKRNRNAYGMSKGTRDICNLWWICQCFYSVTCRFINFRKVAPVML
jgi:hypothetical protein